MSSDSSDSEEGGRKRKFEEVGDDEVRTPRGSAALGRLQSGGGNAMRDKVHKLLTDALSVGEDVNRQRVRAIAEEVETSLYDTCKGVNEQYKKKAQTLKFNLSTNEELREQVLERDILAVNLVVMSTADLARKDLKKRRVKAAEESLTEVVNNEEVQKLKQAAAGLSMRKTDQGLVALQEKEKEEEAKRKEEEAERARERTKKEEEEKKRKEKETIVTAGLDMGQDDEKSYLSTFTWKPQVDGDEDEEGGASLDEPDSMPMSSPTLYESQGELYEPNITMPTLDEESMDGLRSGVIDGPGGHLVWHGTLCPTSGRKDAFDLDASLVDGQGVHDMIPSDLSVKGTLPLQAVKDYLESKMRDKSKVRSVYKLTPHHEQQHDSHAHELYRHFTESLRKPQRAGVLIDSKQMLLYAVPPGNILASSLVNEDDAQNCLIAVALTSRRKEVQRSVEEITADVSADFRTALGAKEKMVKLMAGVIGKVSTSDCNLRASLMAGENRLDKVPRELGVRGRAGLDQVIEYLLQQQVMVVELEPEGEEDSGTYLQISDLLQEKRRAAVVLDTSTALMYLIPPVDEAGKLLDPPADSCSNMLGVLLLNQQAESAGGERAAGEQEPSKGPGPTAADDHHSARAAASAGRRDPRDSGSHSTGNGMAAAAGPSVGAQPDPAPQAGAGREHRPAPVVVSQAGREGGMLPQEAIDPSPRPYYTPAAAASEGWKPMDPGPSQQAQQARAWNPAPALGPSPGRGYMPPHGGVHQPQHQGPPLPYQHQAGDRGYTSARPSQPHHPPPHNHLPMNHPQHYPMDAARGHPTYPAPPGMHGNGMPGPGMPGGPAPMMSHGAGPDAHLYGGQGRGYGPGPNGNANAYHRGPPQGFHRNY